jgi:hypothetical protein
MEEGLRDESSAQQEENASPSEEIRTTASEDVGTREGVRTTTSENVNNQEENNMEEVLPLPPILFLSSLPSLLLYNKKAKRLRRHGILSTTLSLFLFICLYLFIFKQDEGEDMEEEGEEEEESTLWVNMVMDIHEVGDELKLVRRVLIDKYQQVCEKIKKPKKEEKKKIKESRTEKNEARRRKKIIERRRKKIKERKLGV